LTQARFLGLERKQRIHSIRGRSRVVACMAQTLSHHLAEDLVVIHDQNVSPGEAGHLRQIFLPFCAS